MQFKHPEILYALLLLIIPIIVHLFQLQRFTKISFTNVKFLKKIEKQTRKSSRIKKWLVLITRILIFSCLILAFAQPYFSNYNEKQNFNTTIYLDNSFSMQAKGEQGELLKSSINKIIENSAFLKSNISLLTNDDFSKELDTKNLKNNLLGTNYTPHHLDFNTILLKLNNKITNTSNTLNKNILISDFQSNKKFKEVNFTNVNSQITLLKLSSKDIINYYIDSVYSDRKSSTEFNIKVIIKSSLNSSASIPVSLFSKNNLIGKTTTKFNNSNQNTVTFNIPNATSFNGKISITNDALEFDNNFFFSISKPKKIKVLSIGKTSDFLAKIYTKKEFDFNSYPVQNLNYNILKNQHLIILNEISIIPNTLIENLKSFFNNGGNLVLIPSKDIDKSSYNTFLNTLSIGTITNSISKKNKITTINFEHPILNDVFEKRVTNFQYPTTNFHYQTNFRNYSNIVTLDNNYPFITSTKQNNNNFYWISSPLDLEVTDFIQSPLVVPIFYNFAKSSLKIGQFYYTISDENKLDINTTIGKDHVLKISNNNSTFIPLQTIAPNKVTLDLQNNLVESGFYTIKSENTLIKTVAFNYNREESDRQFDNLDSIITKHKHVTIATSIEAIFDEINNQQKINWLFKWFLAFSVLFLLIEMLILKYFNK